MAAAAHARAARPDEPHALAPEPGSHAGAVAQRRPRCPVARAGGRKAVYTWPALRPRTAAAEQLAR
eukprot:14409090-Alexandrium_andersonii.AAC.1